MYGYMADVQYPRESRDDGIAATGLLLGPLIATCVLISALRRASQSPTIALPSTWMIEPPLQLQNRTSATDALTSMVESRRSLVDLSTFCSVMLLITVCASWLAEHRYNRASNKPDGERASVPRSEARRFTYYVLFTLGVSVGLLSLRGYFRHEGIMFWQCMFTGISYVLATN